MIASCPSSTTCQARLPKSFGKVAHRFSSYEKRGVRDGTAFAARGRIATQFARTPGGWRIEYSRVPQ
jgi:hypothetical protein